MLLQSALLADGTRGDVRVDAERVVAVGSLVPEPGETVLPLDGRLLLPAPAEPHAHLDKALTADLVPNPAGDLLGAIDAWLAFQVELTAADVARRAERAARRLLANGCTAIRTHVNVGVSIGLTAVEGLLAARAALAGDVHLELVALVERPVAGADGAANRRLLAEAMAAGVDVVGGCPHLDPDPVACLEHCVGLAAELDRPLDLHMDETLDPHAFTLPLLAALVTAAGLGGRATASHSVSLAMQPEVVQRATAEALAAAGVAVVALPHTNLYLQGRSHPVATPRGLTAVGPLLAAGAVLAAGADNLQDPFNPMGRADPLETAALLVLAGHVLPEQAYLAVSTATRRLMGLRSAASLVVAPGDPAELLALPAASVRAAEADQPDGRLVVHQGRLVGTVSAASR
jgi:cytosine/creatinine deaminase